MDKQNSTANGADAQPTKYDTAEVGTEFFNLIHPAKGLRCLFVLPTKQHFWFDNSGDLARAALDYDGRGLAVFHSCAVFGVKQRNQDSVAAIKCLWLDIDVGKFYATAEKAQQDLYRWCDAVRMPDPLLVFSGGGLHVYWPLDEALPPARWKPIAERLRTLAVENGLRIDAGSTIDSARILRPPGTHNRKKFDESGKKLADVGGAPRAVRWVVEVDAYTLAELAPIAAAGVAPTIAVNEMPPAPSFMKGIQTDPAIFDIGSASETPSDPHTIADKCAQVARLRDSGGNLPEPEWYAVLGVLAHCGAAGRDAAHKWSSGDPRYLKGDCDDKLDQYLANAAGPTTCARLGKLVDGVCVLCEHKNRITSPIQLGRDGLAGGAALQPLSGGNLKAWDAGADDYVIPPRGWLLGNVFCRGFLSAIIADGGVGKTALRIAQFLSLAIGRSLTGDFVFHRCRVLILSLEDDRDELRRRVFAAMKHHSISREELRGWLYLATPRDLRIAEVKDGAVVLGALDRALRTFIAEHHIDIVGIDPLIKAHSVEENDNSAMDKVTMALAAIATDYNCAVDLAHHARKGLAVAGDAARGRGAGAMKDGARLVYTLTPMAPEEAKAFGIGDSERRGLVRFDSAKVNIAPPATDSRWFSMVGVALGNGTGDYPRGDTVQTTVPWTPPDIWAGITPTLSRAILDEIAAGLPGGARYSSHNRAGAREARHAVQKHVPGLSDDRARAVIRSWVKKGVLVEELYMDPISRKDRKGLSVVSNEMADIVP